MLLAGCTPASLTPSTPPKAVVSASPSPTASAIDFTRVGAARNMIDQLIAAAGSDELLMAEVTADTVQIGVLKNGQASTWAYRDGTVGKVIGDLTYVNQATFDISRFNIDNVGAIFDAAAAVSGSSQDQALNIVDNAGGDVVMSVTTVPETKTVFFNPNGSLLKLLDFDNVDSIQTGLEEALGIRTLVYSITISASQGVQVVCTGGTNRLVHRSRGLRVPVTAVTIPGTRDLPEFSATKVDPVTIWRVVHSLRDGKRAAVDADWKVVIDDREGHGTARMHFSVGSLNVTTTLGGVTLSE
ncbi:hypothetical protein ATK74_1946 [Propionicimonas paludicola]|uniref:Uncharacterized protein n=2 Tax=Propionicimonas paludicola TaxID=185243 RepID=A0A2A9CUY1_9ACTN|nr:hypothetical protein ATK74_1946 [Propionicimonas paludicola]